MNETLEQKATMTTHNRLTNKSKISFPIEIIQEIISRLPVKSVLQFRSVSKPWLSLISDPSFPKIHLTRSTANHRTALLIIAYDVSTADRHFFSAAPDGGPATLLKTIRNAGYGARASTQHLNGLVLFTSGNVGLGKRFAYIVNPSTRNVYKLPDPASSVMKPSNGKLRVIYFFGFDESTNEHKILHIRILEIGEVMTTIEFMIFSLSNYSWRKIDVDLPFDISEYDWQSDEIDDVCVNSVIHLMIGVKNSILGFNLTKEKFELINIPRDAIPRELHTDYKNKKGLTMQKSNWPSFMKYNGLLGVVCDDRVVENNEMDIWILQDYENSLWVKKTITFPKSWIKLDCPSLLDCVDIDKIGFSVRQMKKDVISMPVYDMKSRRLKSVKFTLGHQFEHPNALVFNHVNCYVESILPLKGNETRTS